MSNCGLAKREKKIYSPLPGVIRLNPTYLRSQRKQEYYSNNYFLLFQSENKVIFLLGHQICRTLVGGWKSQKIQVSYAAVSWSVQHWETPFKAGPLEQGSTVPSKKINI